MAVPAAPSRIAARTVVDVRRLQPGDLGAVSDLFGRIFRRGRAIDADAVGDAVRTLYLSGTAHQSGQNSLVHVGEDGRIDAFLGIMDVAMEIRGRPIRCGVLGSFMSDKSVGPSAAGAKLIRHLSRLPYDVLFSDTASTVSLAMARALHFEHLAVESLRWSVVLRPMMAAAGAAAVRWGSGAGLTLPVAQVADAVLTRAMPRLMQRRFEDGTVDRAMSLDDFKRFAPAYASGYALRPTWSEGELDWLLARDGGRARRPSLQIREVVDRGGRRIGAYLVYDVPYKTVVVLQVLALPRREALVYGALLARAAADGAAVVRGTASPGAVAGLAGRRGLVFRAGTNAIARTRDPEVGAALKAGDHLLGGLVGETWASLATDQFS